MPGNVKELTPKEAQGSPSSGRAAKLHFDVSTGLKRVIGRDLITDDEVAIFELVKNSFDAGARNVQIRFENMSLFVIDDGDGMSLDDVTNKWLFVAYSYKREDTALAERVGFRDHITERKHFAGSKGIGRFSSDRLGRALVMQTRPRADRTGPVHRVEVDWQLFEADGTERFATIPVSYKQQGAFRLPGSVAPLTHGTAVEVQNLRVVWDRARLLHLKSSLAKLINPFGASVDGFCIEIGAPGELAEDQGIADAAQRRGEELHQGALVNGEIGNFIFSTLKEKTTFIEVGLDDKGVNIVTSLTDRGELVYKIREPNPFHELKADSFHCQLFYLNQSAKATFTRRMGLPSVQFGSVFLFRNGFRVFPIGDEGDDWFGIDRRKQQGYARFLGTRDIIGRIDVAGSEEEFKEASSRNQGLIDTASVRALKQCFWEFCLKRLERYVVPVTWADVGEKLSDDLSRLMTDAGRTRVAAAVARLVDNPDVELLDYSRKLVGLANERSGKFEESLVSLRAIAQKTDDKELSSTLERAEKRFEELREAETQALRVAESERKAKELAQAKVERAEAATQELSASLNEERKRTLFLTSITALDTQSIINMHHQITIYAADIKQQVENILAIARVGEVEATELTSRLEQVSFTNQKVLAISRLATKANFRMVSEAITADIADYVEQYVEEGARPFLTRKIIPRVENQGSGFEQSFRPMEVAIVVDNLIDNAWKAKAREVIFKLSRPNKQTLIMDVCDDGAGLPPDLDDLDRVFGLGFSRTSGSGLGLYHVRQVLGGMGGSISVGRRPDKGTCFQVRFSA